jgi:putative ABC transport system ATP-binding protein
VQVRDTEVTGMSAKELTRFRAERVGFVFQSANLVPFLTAKENLLYVSSLVKGISKKQAQERADQLLEELGLSARAKNLPEQLSGGERQRVAIGRALMNDPDLVLVDEPTAALDTAMGRQVVQLLRREIKSRGKTGIMVTHDLRMVEYTDRVFEILDGTLTHVEQPSALQH